MVAASGRAGSAPTGILTPCRPQKERTLPSIVVIGAGLAGLGCANRLARAGHDVEVLEAGTAPGGRVRSERHGDFLIERGAQFIADGYRELHGVIGELGLSSAVHPAGRADEAVLRRGVFERVGGGGLRDFVRSPLLSRAARLGLLRLGHAVWRHGRGVDPKRPETALALDRETLSDFVDRIAGSEARDYLIAPAFAGTFDCEIESMSAAFGIQMSRVVAAGHRMQSLEGGLGLLPEALAGTVAVRTGCRVSRVETETEGARIHYRAGDRERSVVADAAVVAVPGPLVPGLCPKLTPEERGFFESVRYVRGIIVHLMLDARPRALAGLQGVGFPRSSGVGLFALAVDHGKPGVAPSGAGLVNVALREHACDRLWMSDDEAVTAFVLGELARTPLGRVYPLGSVVVRWPLMLPWMRPGQLGLLARFRRRTERSPRLAFAGDYLIGPYTEAALTSGFEAASETLRSLARASHEVTGASGARAR